MKIFDIDGPLYKLMTSLMNVFLLSLCVIVSCIPIVTAGAGIVAGHDVALRMVDNEEGYIVKQFFKAFKNNFKQGFILELITLVGAYAIYLDFQIFKAIPNGSIIVAAVGILWIFIYVFSLLYAYPQVARYENTLPKILRNSFRISMKFFPRSIGVVLLLAIETAAFAWDTTTLFMGIIIGPGCLIYTVASTAKGIFKIIEKDTAAETVENPDYPEKETVVSREQYVFPNAITPEDVISEEGDDEVNTGIDVSEESDKEENDASEKVEESEGKLIDDVSLEEKASYTKDKSNTQHSNKSKKKKK